MIWTKDFAELTMKSVDEAGGKGASLGEMTKAGIPVPPGFVVLASTFDHFVTETNLVAEIESQLKKVNHHDVNTVEHVSKTIQALIKAQLIPEDIKTEIMTQFDALDAEFVAVRSSATSEDSIDAAWAGQLDSFLNIKRDVVLNYVQECWASLFTPRAIFYRFEKELHNHSISVAVVVQKMIQSEISGIAFSVHPVTEDYNQLIIEAGFGLGEAIVSGSITPDSYVVLKKEKELFDTYISEQERQIIKGEDGKTDWVEVEESKRELQKLSNEDVMRLADIIISIEKHYGFPCDIEWALENGEIYIVQSRPITTLSKK